MFDFLDPERGFGSKRRLLAGMMEIPTRFEKTEPKDSIYAILGLIDRKEPEEDVEAALLHVDYTKSLADVLRDATRYALCQNADLHAFRRVNHRMDRLSSTDFPTWTVRADIQREMQDIPLLPVFFKACSGLQPPSKLHHTPYGADILVTEGLNTDSVLETTTTCDGYHWHEYEGYHAWLLGAKRLVIKHRKLMAQTEMLSLCTAMAFALTAGEAYNRRRARPEDILVLTEYLSAIDRIGLQRKDSFFSNEADTDLTCDRKIMDEMYAVSRVTFCMRRRFFVTSSGRVGLGPRCSESGDLVVVLRGGDTPFVLRKSGDEYQFIGSVYVHGIMDGEAVSAQIEAGGLSEVVFPIR
jgi:hypothetical protein